MKIWVAKLILTYYKDEWETIFNFELSDREYELNERRDGYIYSKGWICDRIPVNIEIEKTWTGLKVQQGFDRELNEEELREVKSEMKNLLLKDLEYEKDEYLKRYEDKVKVLREEI